MRCQRRGPPHCARQPRYVRCLPHTLDKSIVVTFYQETHSVDNLTADDRHTAALNVVSLWTTKRTIAGRRDVRLLDQTYGFPKRRTAAGRDVRLLNETYGCWATRTATGRDIRLLGGTYGCLTRRIAVGRDVRLLDKIDTAAAYVTYGWRLWKGDVLLLWT